MNRQTYLEIDDIAIQYNLDSIKKSTHKQIMPVIKANAYGTGLDNMIEIAKHNNFEIVCVALVSEGMYVREKGFEGDILILNQPFKSDIENILKYNLIAGCCDIEFLKELNNKANTAVKIHFEIDSGMSRTGAREDQIIECIHTLKQLDKIDLNGIYTHYATSDEANQEYKKMQDRVFKNAVENFDLKNVKYIHSSNSGAVINGHDDITNAIRPGIMMYGYYPSEINFNKVKIKPATKLISRISYLKTIPRDVSVSYGRRYITKADTKIATVPIGYADGISRQLTNKGKVVINNEICNVIGSVCMDNILIDVTHLKDVNIDDIVYIWDNDKLKLEDIARTLDTINYEVISGISNRVERIYLK